MHAALRELVVTDDSSGLIGVLSLLARGGAECSARKLMAFNTVAQRIVPRDSISHDEISQNESHLAEEMDTEHIEKSSKSEQKSEQSSTDHRHVQSALRVLYQFLIDWIDDFKYKAFKSAFLEPTKLFFDAVYDTTMRDDVDVHGSNVYAAILLSTLGVKLPVFPLMRDEPKGCATFLRAQSLQPCFDEMSEPSNFGRDWNTLPKSMKYRTIQTNDLQKVQRNAVVFHGTPMEMGNAALSTDKSNEALRKELALYLERFAFFFSKQFFLEKAMVRVMGEEGRSKELQVVFEAMKKEGKLKSSKDDKPSAEDSSDVREWIYKGEAYSFDPDRAALLFSEIGITQ